MTLRTAAMRARGKGAATLASGVLLVVLGGYTCIAMKPAPVAGPSAPGRAPVPESAPAANPRTAAPVPMSTPEAQQTPAAAATGPPTGRAPSRPADMPYRFVGKSSSGTEPSVVLLGRGRVVTVHGPRALDDEYVVEAVFDDYLVVRHLPTGAGSFVQLAQRQQVVAPRQDPEDSPRD